MYMVFNFKQQGFYEKCVVDADALYTFDPAIPTYTLANFKYLLAALYIPSEHIIIILTFNKLSSHQKQIESSTKDCRIFRKRMELVVHQTSTIEHFRHNICCCKDV